MVSFDPGQIGRAIFEESGDALFLFDPENDRLIEVNAMAERLTGVARKNLLEQPATYWVRFSGEERQGMQRLRQAANQSSVFLSQDGFYLRTASDGVWIPVNLTIARLHLKPKTLALMTARDIREQRAARTPLKEKEAELREREIRLQAIMDNSPAIIAVKDRTGRYLIANRRLQELFPGQQLRGKTPFDLLPRETAQMLQDHDQKVLETKRAMEFEEVIANGSESRVYCSVKFPFRDAAGRIYALGTISTDITERKRAEEDRNRFFTLSVDMLCTAGYDGYFKRLNQSWQQVLGWSLEELLGRPYIEFIHPDDRAATIAEAEKISQGYTTISFENRYRCADGSYKWLSWTAIPDQDQNLVYAAARDITQRKKTEQELAKSAGDLAMAYQEAQLLAKELEKAVASERQAHHQLKKTQSRLVQSEKLVALGQMVAGVAHEINNPLTFLSNNFTVLERDVLALRDLMKRFAEADTVLKQHQPELFRAIQEYGEAIDLGYILNSLGGIFARSREGLRRIQQIVTDLRSFARMDEGDLHEVNLNTGVESTINIVRGHALKKRINLKVEPGKLPLVTCYPAKINQVVMNLVANAIDACPENGEVVVRTTSTADGVELHVSDNGPGIPAAIRDRIFDPFFTTKPPGKGTGLGLSISHGIVEDHGGRIDFESDPQQGTHFIVTLPLKPPAR
ncbi:MAG: PAS domain S-box protein [Planctomycetes bacterium]|nr:PAS domain S-box protein [Planctomycetota bacterium]